MRREIVQRIEKVGDVLADTIVGVVGRRVSAQGKGRLQRGLILTEDLEGRADARSRCGVHDFCPEFGMVIAERPENGAKGVCVQRLQQAIQRHGPSGDVRPGPLHLARVRGTLRKGRIGGRGGHADIVIRRGMVIFGLSFAASRRGC